MSRAREVTNALADIIKETVPGVKWNVNIVGAAAAKVLRVQFLAMRLHLSKMRMMYAQQRQFIAFMCWILTEQLILMI